MLKVRKGGSKEIPLVQGKEQKISYKDKKLRSVPKREWVCIPNHHEAIISKEVFEQVRQLRSSRCRKK